MMPSASTVASSSPAGRRLPAAALSSSSFVMSEAFPVPPDLHRGGTEGGTGAYGGGGGERRAAGGRVPMSSPLDDFLAAGRERGLAGRVIHCPRVPARPPSRRG